MGSPWTDFLHAPTACGHAVQVYADVDELAESVTAYLAAGFDAGAPGLVVATPDHFNRFSARLRSAGHDVRALQAGGLLTVFDAEQTLGVLMGRDGPSPLACEQVLGAAIDSIGKRFPGQQLRAFGEMVDLLHLRGRGEDAVALEELWNDLARTRDFALLCGYRLDVFDVATQRGALPDVCRVHSHVLPAPDPERLAAAVRSALGDVLGGDRAAAVYATAGAQQPEHVPLAQRALMWISASMPASADRILERARWHYADAPLSAAT